MTKEQQELINKTLNRLYREEKEQCMTIVTSHCVLCSGTGAVPFVGNAGALLPIHTAMIKKLGEVFNIELTDTEAQNIATPPTGKVVGRSVGKFFTSIVPGVGSAIDAKLAYDVTENLAWKTIAVFLDLKGRPDEVVAEEKTNEETASEDSLDVSIRIEGIENVDELGLGTIELYVGKEKIGKFLCKYVKDYYEISYVTILKEGHIDDFCRCLAEFLAIKGNVRVQAEVKKHNRDLYDKLVAIPGMRS